MMSTTAMSSTLWVAEGDVGVVGMIRKDDDGYTVTMAGAGGPAGTYPTSEIAKRALHARMTPGSDWPRFRQH